MKHVHVRRGLAAGLAAALGAALMLATPVQATVESLTINSPTAATSVAPGGTVNVDITWSESHVCGPYRSHITIGDPVAPVAQQTFDYVEGVDIPDGGGGCNSSPVPREHNFVHTMTIPPGTAAGLYDLEVFTEENFFGAWCCGRTATQSQVIQVVVGGCPNGSWFLETVPANDPFDKNGDGYICTKDVNGQGNSANTQRPPGQSGYHVDGHNHKDNKG